MVHSCYEYSSRFKAIKVLGEPHSRSLALKLPLNCLYAPEFLGERSRHFMEHHMSVKIAFSFVLFLAVALGGATESQAAKVGDACGGFGGIKCDQGLWCDPTPGQCGFADASGVCVKVGRFCPQAQSKSIVPVCGCDGRSYNNDCERQKKHVGKKNDGSC